MENASKALIMAAEVLIGIMIISVGVYLFNNFANYSRENYQRIERTQIGQFNNNFMKYVGTTKYTTDSGEKEIPIACTIHDIVGVANFAQKHNFENELLIQNATGSFSPISGDLSGTIYVQVDFGAGEGIAEKRNLEQKSTTYLADLVKKYALDSEYDPSIGKTTTWVRYFVCEIDNGDIDEETGRIKKVNFIREFTESEYDIMNEINGN